MRVFQLLFTGCMNFNPVGSIRLGFSISTQAMLLKDMQASLLFPYGTYSINLPFPKSALRRPVKCTFMITDPSFKCRFTFLPRKDLALFKPKLSMLTHQLMSLSAMTLQHCLQIGSFSPLNIMYSLMFSLWHLFFQGFLQCSKFVKLPKHIYP